MKWMKGQKNCKEMNNLKKRRRIFTATRYFQVEAVELNENS